MVAFDKRLELIYGLQYYVSRKYNVKFYWIKENYKEYNAKFYEMCDGVITEQFEKYILNGGLDSYNRCIDIAFHLDENYGFINCHGDGAGDAGDRSGHGGERPGGGGPVPEPRARILRRHPDGHADAGDGRPGGDAGDPRQRAGGRGEDPDHRADGERV